jgi:hypothetical protein
MGDARVFFFCMGATKAGTTWLHDQLAAHPQCHLRTIKEYHYFSSTGDGQWAKMIADTRSEIAALTAVPPSARSAYQVARLDDLTAWLPQITPRAANPAGFAQFLLDGAATHNPNARVMGDFTPAYSVVRGKWLEPILTMEGIGGAAVKVIYLLRDPLARVWSHIRMTADRMAPDRFAETAQTMLERMILGADDGGIQGIVRRGDYAGNLPKLRRIFGARLLVMFTEDLFTAAGFARVLAHLGLAPRAPDTQRRVHGGRDLPFPAGLRRAALQFLRPQYQFVAGEFDNLPQAWRDAMAEIGAITHSGPLPQEVRI